MGENVEEMKIAAAGDGGDLGDLEYSVNKLSTEGSNPLPWIIIGVVFGVIAILIVYVVVVKLICGNDSMGMPISAFQSKFAGKLQSSSSIKTIKSNEELKAAAKSMPKRKK